MDSADALMAVPVPLEPTAAIADVEDVEAVSAADESAAATDSAGEDVAAAVTEEPHVPDVLKAADEAARRERHADEHAAAASALSAPISSGSSDGGRPAEASEVTAQTVATAAVTSPATAGRRRAERAAGRGSDKGEPSMMLPSFIWDYFVKDATGKFVVCTLCPDQATRFAYSGGTSTMNRHLRKKHQKYAPGKSAADYEYPRKHRAHAQQQQQQQQQQIHHHHVTTPVVTLAAPHQHAGLLHASVSGLLPPDAAVALAGGSMSPAEASRQRQQVLELRNSRRKANAGASASSSSTNLLAMGSTPSTSSNKRRKLHSGSAASAGLIDTPASTVVEGEFDPSAFVSLPGSSASNGVPLAFPATFELGDAAMELGLEQRFFDYSTLLGSAMTPAVTSIGVGSGGNGIATSSSGGSGSSRSRRSNSYSNSGGGGATSASSLSAFNFNSMNLNTSMMMLGGGGGLGAASTTNATNQKLLTHRLLKYLIAQFEPLDVSHMGNELNLLLYGNNEYYPSFGLSYPTLPSEDAIKRALANLYYSQREMLKDVLAEVDVLSLSLDNWTSVFGQNVLTVSGHWISPGFSRRDCVLEVYVLPLDESVNTIALLRDVMDKWDIPAAKVAALTMVTDGNMQSQIHDEFPALAVVDCFVHALDAAVTAGLQKCAPLIRRCRNYVSYFIQNPSEYQIFLSLQRRMAEASAANSAAAAASSASASTSGATTTTTGTDATGDDGEPGGVVDHVDGEVNDGHPDDSSTASDDSTSDNGDNDGDDDGQAEADEHTANAASSSSNGTNGNVANSGNWNVPPVQPLPVICDFEDRWNSTIAMICRIVELEPMLLLYKTGLESDTSAARRPMQLRFVCCELSRDEWATLKQLARLLEPIEGVVQVSELDFPTLSIVSPVLHSLRKHLGDAAQWIDNSVVAAVRNAIAGNLKLELCSSGAHAPASAHIACLLDPRFKTLPFLPGGERDRLAELLLLLHSELVGDSATTSSGDHKSANEEENHGKKPVSGGANGDKTVGVSGSGSATATATANSSSLSTSRPVSATSSSATRSTPSLLHEFFPLEDPPASDREALRLQTQQFLDTPSLPAANEGESDPLAWWGRYRRALPLLARLAKRYLCMSAVSVSFREAFTNVGQLMREKKARLDIEVAAQVLFCRSVSRIPEMERMNV
jgi:hypothetical protein